MERIQNTGLEIVRLFLEKLEIMNEEERKEILRTIRLLISQESVTRFEASNINL